jgi:chorismate mutase
MHDLDSFRARLDALDAQIVAAVGERFAVCRAIAEHKVENAIPMMQHGRLAEVRARYLTHGDGAQLPPGLAERLFELLTSATCAMEDEIIASREGDTATRL